MFNIPAIAAMQVDTIAQWHLDTSMPSADAMLAIAIQQHRFNYDLWHEEDIARSPDVTDAQIAQVKRNIDRLNQKRNDWIEKLDDFITDTIDSMSIVVAPDARQNSETPGSIIDRMSIMALRIYHLQEQLERTDAAPEHRAKVAGRLAICQTQRLDLQTCVEQLLDDVILGKKRHRTYRQFKMYNDPTMNPYLYNAKLNPAA